MDPDKPKYSAYLAVLALAGALDENLADRASSRKDEATRMAALVTRTIALLDDAPEIFEIAYKYAYQTVAELGIDDVSDDVGDARVGPGLTKKISFKSFVSLFLKVRMRIDAD